MIEPDPAARGCVYATCCAVLFFWPALCAVVFVVGVILRWW